MNRHQKPLIAAFVSAAAISLTACGGGGGGGSPAAEATSGTVVTVSPSLGKFSAGAHVRIKKANGDSAGTADTTSAGTAAVNIGSYAGPLLVEVSGDSAVTYYDEGAKAYKPFGLNEVLRAIAPSFSANIGVTPATHAGVEAIKSDNGGSIPSGITTDAINLANNKIAVALGIADILQAPKLVDASTASSLDLANFADKYALKLAALAKLASTGKTALDVAKDIANDLRDGKLDGKFTPANGAVINNSSTSYTATSIAADIAAKLKEAASEMGTDDTKKLVNDDATLAGSVNTDVTQIKTPPAGTSSAAILLAKNLFSELRTTLKSFSNSKNTGFLDLQAVRASDDMKLVVAPSTDKLSNRLGLINMAVQTYEDAQPGATSSSLQSGTGTADDNTTPIWFIENGNLNDVVAGRNGTQRCYIPTSATSGPVTCYTAGVDSVVATVAGSPTVKLLKIVLTPTATGQYTYVATRENRTWNSQTNALGAATLVDLTATCGTGGCKGTVARTGTTTLVVGGTLPPSTATTGADTWALSVVKNLTTAKNYRFAVSGLVSTSSTAATPKPVSFSLDTGSYIDTDETDAATTGTKLVGINLVGTVKTDVTKLTGTITMSGIVKDKSGTSTLPNSVVFNGVISDISTGGAGDMLTGKVETTLADYGNFDATAPITGTNYVHGTAAFTGTVQAPSRPLLKLVLSSSATGANASNVTLNYTYGAISITGSGKSTGSGSTFTISNQDGIQIAADPANANQNLITKAGAVLGTFSSGVINYVDGSSESFN